MLRALYLVSFTVIVVAMGISAELVDVADKINAMLNFSTEDYTYWPMPI